MPRILQTTINDNFISYTDDKELGGLKKEIFDRHCYYFETTNPAPLIFDIGAHLGLASLYFKQIYPGAQVVAVEPNPYVWPLLHQNITRNGLTDVTVIEKAVSTQVGQQSLHIDQDQTWHSTASFLAGAWTHDQKTTTRTISTITLAQLLADYPQPPHPARQRIDLLKLDIEGAEYQVLLTAGPELSRVANLIFEYHPQSGQQLELLLKHLATLGFFLEEPLTKSELTSHKLQLLHLYNKKHPSS